MSNTKTTGAAPATAAFNPRLTAVAELCILAAKHSDFLRSVFPEPDPSAERELWDDFVNQMEIHGESVGYFTSHHFTSEYGGSVVKANVSVSAACLDLRTDAIDEALLISRFVGRIEDKLEAQMKMDIAEAIAHNTEGFFSVHYVLRTLQQWLLVAHAIQHRPELTGHHVGYARPLFHVVTGKPATDQQAETFSKLIWDAVERPWSGDTLQAMKSYNPKLHCDPITEAVLFKTMGMAYTNMLSHD